MSVREFRDDDAGCLAWLAAHPDGYVINIARSHSATEARVHHAGCRAISGQSSRGGTWTGPYVKVCEEHLAELERWGIDQVGESIRRCGICHPARDTRCTVSTERADGHPVPDGRWEIHGPAVDSAVVDAWADDYIRFESRPVWQDHLRDEIRSRCGHLEPKAGQVLHATFFGAKHPNADVENLLLYYFDSLKSLAATGSASSSTPRCRRPRRCRVTVLLPLRARAAVGHVRRLAAGANAGVVRLDRPGRVHW